MGQYDPSAHAAEHRCYSSCVGESDREKVFMSKMKNWIRAACIACLVELPLLIKMEGTPISDFQKFVPSVLGWYHLPGIWVSNIVLLIWNPGPRLGPTPASNAVSWFTIFSVQVLLTTPVIYGLLRWIQHARAKTEPGGRPLAAGH